MTITRQLLLVWLFSIALFFGFSQTAHSQPLCQVVSPKRFAKLHFFPVEVVAQLSSDAKAETFRATLNDIDITFMFKAAENGLQAVIGPKDGLRVNTKTFPPQEINVLKISVEDLESKYYAEFETFFFIEVDRLFTLGPEGGTVDSLDGGLSVSIPEKALSSLTPVAISRVYDPRGIAPAYQLAPVGILFDEPVTIGMKYDPNRVPVGVMQDDLFLVSGKEFPSRIRNSVVDKATEIVSGTVSSFSRVSLSYYLTIGKQLSDVPLATDFRLPIGDTSNASYSCGKQYIQPTEDDLGETLGLLDRSSYADSDEPRIIFNENNPAKTWQVATAFGQKKTVGVSSETLAETIVNNGEDWYFAGYRKERQHLPVHAIADGLVIYNGWGYGKAIVLAHRIPAGAVLSVYSHMREKSHCAVGTVVRKGNVIGIMGGMGSDDGYLHFEIGKESLISIDGKTGDIKVPAAWFGEWSDDSVREYYYDPTIFLSNMMGKYKWGFNVRGNEEGWVPKNVEQYDGEAGYEVRDGALSVKLASGHFEIESYPMSLMAESFDSVFVTMMSNPARGHVTVYFATNEEPGYSEDKAAGFEMLDQGGSHEYRAFMEDNTKWKGVIVGIRISVEVGGEGLREVDFDSIRLGRAYLSRLPDTGQTKCYDDGQEITCPIPGLPFYGQDANYTISSPHYEIKSINGDEVVIDQVTGLMWQKDGDGETRTWPDAMDYGETLCWAGYSDWRLPTKKELQSIANYGGFGPCLDTSFFPYTHGPEARYWSDTTLAFLSKSAWSMSLWNSEQKMQPKDHANYVRAVRGRPLEFGHFRDNGDYTVTGITTGLMWQQTETKAMSWEKALAYCEALDLAGYTDWRLPNIRELFSLVDDMRQEPSIDTVYFPGCRPLNYWSGTTNALYPNFGWYVGFDDGKIYGGGEKGRRQYVRAVRNAE